MTHMSNYANDRLAYYVFDALFKMVQCWTTLQLHWKPPRELAALYFQRHPEEAVAIWRDPCRDKRHRALWRRGNRLGKLQLPSVINNDTTTTPASGFPTMRLQPGACPARLPGAVLLGPQKTGSTALWAFLRLHPAVLSSHSSPHTFEEVQFFSAPNYGRGLDWYLDHFPGVDREANGSNSIPEQLLFEKSANYFDGERVPARVAALLPSARLLVSLIDPARRAYSWYHHQRAHGDPAAHRYTFDQVIGALPLPHGDRRAAGNLRHRLRRLRSRCLLPGIYANHLERWLRYYPSKQILVVDGDQLRTDPPSVMHLVQRFLRLKPVINYNHLLRFEPRKQFFCALKHPQLVSFNVSATASSKRARVRCLGRSKGRRYAPMSNKAASHLHAYYQKHNVALLKLLKRSDFVEPGWLRRALAVS